MPSPKQLFDIHQTKLEVADKDKAPIRRRCAKIGGQEGRIEAADSEAAATSTTQKLGKEVDVQPRPTSLAKQPGKHLTYVIEAATRPKLSLKGSIIAVHSGSFIIRRQQI